MIPRVFACFGMLPDVFRGAPMVAHGPTGGHGPMGAPWAQAQQHIDNMYKIQQQSQQRGQFEIWNDIFRFSGKLRLNGVDSKHMALFGPTGHRGHMRVRSWAHMGPHGPMGHMGPCGPSWATWAHMGLHGPSWAHGPMSLASETIGRLRTVKFSSSRD